MGFGAKVILNHQWHQVAPSGMANAASLLQTLRDLVTQVDAFAIPAPP